MLRYKTFSPFAPYQGTSLNPCPVPKIPHPPAGRSPSVGAGPARAGWRKRRPFATLSRKRERVANGG